VPSFKGQFEHSVDNKGRVAFPAKLRKLVSPEAQDHFTILRGIDPCLYLYPLDKWEAVEDRITGVNEYTRKGRAVIRNFLRYAEDLVLDKQNRLSLPSDLMAWAGITTSAIFIGSGESIEIWSPEKLEQADEDLSFESYQKLFEQVMGGELNDED